MVCHILEHGLRKGIHTFGMFENQAKIIKSIRRRAQDCVLYLYSFFNAEEGKYVVKRFNGTERVYVDSVKLKSNDTGTLEKNSIVITLRVPVII